MSEISQLDMECGKQEGAASSAPYQEEEQGKRAPSSLPPCSRLEDGKELTLQQDKEEQRWFHHRISLFIFCSVACNIGMFFVTMYINDCPRTSHNCLLKFLDRLSFQPIHENPLLGPSDLTLGRLGALDAFKVAHSHQGWRLITCMWLHAGLVHIFVNMLSLLVVGVQLEQEFGSVRVGIIYLLSGFGGSVLTALFFQNRNELSVGASGALFGILGAMLSELLTNWTLYENKCAVMTTLVFVISGNLAAGILPYVDNFGHIGGLIVGFLLGFVLLVKPQFGWAQPANLSAKIDILPFKKGKHKTYQIVLWVVALILLIAEIVSVTVMVFRGVDGNKKCGWCHYLSCVPTAKWKCHESYATCKSRIMTWYSRALLGATQVRQFHSENQMQSCKRFVHSCVANEQKGLESFCG